MTGKAERIPRTPKGVGPQGKRLWAEVLGEHELTQSELAILTAACRCITVLERIADELEGSQALTSTTSSGSVVSSPLLVEQRQQAASLTRLIASLRLPEESDVARPQRRSGARGAYGLRAVQ